MAPDPAIPAAAGVAPPLVVAPRWGAWTPPPDERAITVGGVLGEVWRTYRRALGALLTIGAVVGLLAILLSLPTEIYSLRIYDAVFTIIFDTLKNNANNNGIYDPLLLRTQLEAIVRMPTGVAITFAVASGASTGLALLGGCVLTAAAMTARAGRRVSPGAAVGAVLRHGTALVLPAALLALGSAAVTLAVELNSQAIQDSDFSSTTATGISAGQAALEVAAIVIGCAIFYLSVRWALAIAAILAEDIGLRAGLRRSSQLTRGHRLRLAAIVIVVGILQGLTVTLPSVVLGIVVGMTAGDASPGIVAFALAGVVGSALWAPVGSTVAAVAYGRLTEAARGAAPGS